MQPSLPRRYRVLSPLGQGGMGDVWLVADRFRGDALVALKTLSWRGEQPGPSAGDEILKREFVMLARLAHPNICRVRDFGHLPDGKGAFFTSDFVEGGSLLEWACGAPAREQWSQFAEIAAQALSALAYLSLRGVRHGDVKPQNMLVGRSGEGSPSGPRLRLIDFGTSQLLHLAASGMRAGTPAYRPAPELLETPHVDLDLYGLGMSLFHAAAGRLPFALGDRDSLRVWLSSREPARVRPFEPSVPAALDSLIAGLTSTTAQDRFRSAVEALEFLKARVSLPSTLRPPEGETVWFSGREAFVDEIVRAVTDSRGKARIEAVVGPPGYGKTRVLEALEAALQVRGYRTVFFAHAADSRALAEAWALCGDTAPNASETPIGPREAAACLARSNVAVLLDGADDARMTGGIDDGPATRSREFLEALAGAPAAAGRPGARPSLIAAASSPEAIARLLKVDPARLRIHPLEPLSTDAVSEAVREFFAVDTVPGEIVERIASESGGQPGLVREALFSLREAGATPDFLGHLRSPARLPARLVAGTRCWAPLDRLRPREKRALGLLIVGGEPLSAAGATARFPEWDEAEWRPVLESLRWRGLIRRAPAGEGDLYYPALAGDGLARACGLAAGQEETARRVLAGYHRKHRRTSGGESLLAASRNFLAIGDHEAAVRFALRARAKILPRDRLADVLDVMLRLIERLGGAAACAQAASRTIRLLPLRAAEGLESSGRHREALRLLEPAPDAPVWFQRRIRWLRVEAHERLGDIASAIVDLESVRVDPAASDMETWEATARLASLCFRTGDHQQGRAAMAAGQEILERASDRPARASRTDLARVLGLFASAESVHGDPRTAIRYLEGALRLLPLGGPDHLFLRPLNELGILYAEQQRWPEALETFDRVEEITRRRTDVAGRLRAVYNRAIIHYRLSDLDRAETLFREARAISEGLGTHPLSAAVWLGFAGVLRERGRNLEALRLYRRVIRSAQGVRPNDRAVAHNNSSEIYLALGRLEKARYHAIQALRVARRMENRFLLGLALRSRGMARCMLGRPQAAERDLRRGLELATRDGDARGMGASNLYLGHLASGAGDPGRAIRFFRAAVGASRRARDLPITQAGIIALSWELLTLGRSRAASHSLADGRWRNDTSRYKWLAQILAARLSREAAATASSLQALCREAARMGNFFEAFLALTGLLRDPALPADEKAHIAKERELLAFLLTRRIRPRHARQFYDFWRVERRPHSPDDSAGQGRQGPLDAYKLADQGAGPERSHGQPTASSLDLEAVLEDLRTSAGATRAWLVLDRRRDHEPYMVAGGEGAEARSVLERSARYLEANRRGERNAGNTPPFLFWKLSHTSAERVLCLQAPGGGWPSGPAFLGEMDPRIAFLSMLFQLRDSEADLREAESREAESRAEVARLHSLLSSGPKAREEGDTGLLTTRMEVLDFHAGAEASDARKTLRSLVVASPAMKRILRRLPALASQDLPILLTGESGVGKDLVARRIHHLSRRRGSTFLTELCNVPETLIEAELFGYVRGAFTGAVADRAGLFERTAGGTIYLDEISELSPRFQARLLRVLEEKQIRPLGSEKSVAVDFRLISSTSRSLGQLLAASDFRKDLYYRLGGEVLEIPPLRERPEDIPAIARTLLKRYAERTGAAVPYLTPDAEARLLAHSWPGNVRELMNELERVLLAKPLEITVDMLFPGLGGTSPAARRPAEVGKLPRLKDERLRLERELVLRALAFHKGNASHAARALGITRRYLGTLVEKHGIRLAEFRTGKKTGGAEAG